MMKKLLMSGALLLFAAALAVAQNNAPQISADKKPNLSGVWVSQDERQRKPEAGPDGWIKLLIEQREPNLKFTINYPPNSKSLPEEFNFYTDERGESNHKPVLVNVSANDQKLNEAVKSRTRWEGNVLVMSYSLIAHDGQMTLNMELTMRWQLSADAQTLIRTLKMVITSAKILKKTGDVEKEEDLPLTGRKENVYTDVYLLLDAKQ